jgi:hypothetical protein
MASKSNKQSTGKTGTGSSAPAPSLAAAVDASSPRGGERTRNKEGKSTSSNPPRSSTAPAFAGSSRIPKPSKEDLEQLSNEIQTQINVLQNESKDIKKQIDKLLDARNGSKVTSSHTLDLPPLAHHHPLLSLFPLSLSPHSPLPLSPRLSSSSSSRMNLKQQKVLYNFLSMKESNY